MVFAVYSIIFLFGLGVGSFLNVVILRLYAGEPFMQGRSHCVRCKKNLSWKDLIPVLSFILLRGTCRYCSANISWQYPFVELTTGLLFVYILFQQNGATLQLMSADTILQIGYLFTVAAFLIAIFIYDLKYFLIPDKLLFPLVGLVMIYRIGDILWHGGAGLFMSTLVAVTVGAGFFLLIFLISRGQWMGFGDVKLAVFMGLFLGWPNILVALFVAFLTGAIIGIVLITAKKKGMKSEIPFGPFLIFGTFIAFFFGNSLIQWYSYATFSSFVP